jgi:hypothetical protein
VKRERQEAEQRAKEMAERHKAELAETEAKWATAMSVKAREEEWARGHQDAVHDAAVAREALAAIEREVEGKIRGGEAAWSMERARMVAEHEEALRGVEAARREQVLELEAKIEAARREAAERLRYNQ